MLLQECNKLGLLSDSNTESLTSERYTFLWNHWTCMILQQRLRFCFFFVCFVMFYVKVRLELITFHLHPTPTPISPPTSPNPPSPTPLHIWFRTVDREFVPRVKTAENANIQPNPGLILRAEPTVTNILKVDHQDGRLMCGNDSFDALMEIIVITK